MTGIDSGFTARKNGRASSFAEDILSLAQCKIVAWVLDPDKKVVRVGVSEIYILHLLHF